MEILKASNIIKQYGSGETEVKALNGVNVSIKKGEFVTVIGPSGSGKSTLLHMLGGMDQPTSGYVEIEGTNISNLKEEQMAIFRRRNMGFVFQSFNLIPVLTAEENIKLPVLLDGKKVDEEYFNEIVSLLGIQKRVNHFPNQLSGGEQQRVAIARALCNKPAIILADEPTGNLDSKTSKEIMQLLHYSIKKYNQTLIMITHDMNLAAQGSRVLTIEDGVIVKDEVM